MLLAWLRRAGIAAGWLAFASAGGFAVAAENLPALRVDPSLLGAAAPARLLAERPPEVAERAALAPLYSAHAAAGIMSGFTVKSVPPVD
ncbi:MAG: hypothetical protein Q7U32_07860, partial [Rhodocyclaceae bacterium]|nr:hypothetical protein [Rhodocyclaceae bacterium]